MRHRAREWRADHGGARLPPFKLTGSAVAADGAEVIAKVRRWAEAIEAKEPEGARLIRAELGREGVELFPWRFDAAAADLQAMPSAAELAQLTSKVELLLASRDACMLRSSYHAALLDRRALAKLGVELETRARTWTLKAAPRTRLKAPPRTRLDARARRAGLMS